MSYTTCGCTEPIASETAAQHHAATCELMGLPAHPTTCRITVNVLTRGRYMAQPCGEPAVAGALCERHLRDKERLS